MIAQSRLHWQAPGRPDLTRCGHRAFLKRAGVMHVRFAVVDERPLVTCRRCLTDPLEQRTRRWLRVLAAALAHSNLIVPASGLAVLLASRYQPPIRVPAAQRRR